MDTTEAVTRSLTEVNTIRSVQANLTNTIIIMDRVAVEVG